MDGELAPPTAMAGSVADRVNIEGTDVVGDVELLSLVIGGRDGRELAARLIDRVGSLKDLARVEGGALPRTKGLTPARTARIQAAIELGKRSLQPRAARMRIESPTDAAALIRSRLQHASREHFGVILLDARNGLIAWRTIAVGTLNGCIVHPREVFSLAVQRGAARVVLFHGHPSGQADPSQEDIALTRRLVEIGRLMGIEVVDHVIVGDGTFHSMKSDSGVGW